MATAQFIKSGSDEFDLLEDIVYNSDVSGNPYGHQAITYSKDSISDNDFLLLTEKIAFIIDCYTTFYEKLGNIEDRLGIIEKQNKEILLLLSKEQTSVMAISAGTESFIEMDAGEMKARIIEYYETHKFVYPSDIACEFNLDLEKVVSIIDDLISEGKVIEA